MGTFNFSNMQGGQQQETQNIPREFRPAVEQAKTEPVGSYGNNKTGFWDEVKNFFSGADVDTSAGFIDETGTWNNGTKQELAKYYPTQKSAEELEKDRLGSLWDRTYKKYHYSKDDVLLEAKKISAATNIPENAILANADNLANARNVYNYQQKAMDPQAVFAAYPELSELAKLSDTDAAIALHNLKNVRQTQGIIEAAKTGWELDNLMSERGRMGYAAMNGKELTDADFTRLGEIEKAQKNSKELPGLFEDPMSAIVGGTVQSGKMMLRNALNGQKMGVYGAGFGALLGGIAGGGATLGAGTAAGAAAGAKIGYSVGSRIGMAQDMYDEIAGNNYLDYKGYKDKQGRQLLTDNQARSYAAVAAALETGIEFSNADKILNVIKGGAGAQSIKEIISSAKDSTELQSLLAAYLRDSAKNIGTVAISESAEEGVQEMSNRIISDIAAANNPGGDIPTYTAKDIIVGGLEASWQALPASIGFGAGAHGASTVSFMRRASAALQLKSEEQRANLRDANGISMLRSLAEDIKNNALFKKAPEVYNEVLNNQLKGTELETINIDTEYVLNQQGGYELLKSAAKAAGIGEQYLKDIIDTKADLKISTADYVSKLLPTEIGAHLEDYITFSDISECLARNREYAGRMRREMDHILAYENRQREDALNTYLDNNFHTPETREIAEAVLRRFPDNPKEGVKEIRKSLQAKIDEPLNQIIEELEKGMGNGVAVVEIPEYDNQMRGRGIKVSNNDPWYQRYYKENKHKPSKMELRELAREIWTGHNEYGLFGWENRTPEDNQWYENNKASMEATEEAIRRLDALTPALEAIDPGELSITEGLSEEGFEVYRKLRGKLEGAESKEVRQAAQMSAIIAARMADRMAELHRQVGHTKYTALDYARSIGLIRSESEAAEQKFNQAVNVGINENTKYKLLDLDILQDNIGTDKETPEANQKAIDYIKHVLTENEPVATKDLSSVFDFSKMSEYDQRHIVLAKSQRGRKNKTERHGRNLTISNPREILQNAVLVEINPSKHSNEVDNKLREDIKGSLSYRFVIPVKLNGQAQTLVITAIGTSANVLKKLNEVTLYEVYTTKIPPSQRQASLKDGGIGDVSKETIPSEYSLAEILAKVKDLNHKPYVDKETGKLIIEDQMAIGSMKLDQKAWRGASELLNEHGIKGIAYEGMKDGRCFVVFDDKGIDIIERYNQSAGGRSYSMDSDQRGLWQLKGQTAFKTTGEKVISLFKAADQSTFMHEMAHIYLHDMLALAELPNAPKQLLDDVATINKWAAWNDTQFAKEYKGTAMESEFKKLNEQMKTAVAKGSVDIEGKEMTLEQMQRLWMQERFARGFENYLKSGDAPTEATRSIFRRFKQWLTKIYRAFSQIGGAPSKEVKEVMDRMIASEDEIDIAMRKKGVDDFAESGGMDYLEGSTKDVYRRMVERAKADAEEKVLKIALKDVKEDYRQQEKELFEREEAEYREKLAAEPVFIIQEHIKNNPNMSTSVICETLGMNVEDYVKQLKEYGGSLDAAVKAHMKEFKEGIDNSGIDAQYFRERAEEVVQESKYRKLATAMELEAFERIAKKQRNLTTKIEAEGKNDAAEKGVIKTVDKMTRQSKQIEELTAETKGLKQDKRELLANVRGLRDAALRHYKDYVQFVEMKLEVMPIEDANNYQMWRRKSAQAQYNSEQSLIKGNWDKAVKYKQAQLIYDMFADRAVRNAKQIKKIEDGLKRKQQTISKAKNISADERYAYNHLMYVFGFSDADAPVPPHYEGIIEVLMKADATREEGGLMLESPFFGPDGQTNLPEWFLQAAMNSNKRKAGHKDLSNIQVDLVAQVMHIIYKRGMDNMKLATIKTKDGRTLTVDEAVAEIEGQTRQRMIERANADPTGANKNRWQDDVANFIDQADRVLIKPEVELKKLGDVALRYIYDPLKEAADKELKMAVNMQNKLKGLFDAYSPKELADMRNKRLYDFGSSKITKEQAIMIALNWGTETNQQRVLDGYHVNVAQVKNVLQYLDERDWNLVNSIWKLYDIHWDQIREIEARMTGAVLQKQEAKGFVVVGQDRKIYTLDGGYFPIKYDLRDLRTQEQADAAQQSAMSNIAMSLGKGFLKERTQHKVERRLDLRFEVISGSITDVIHLVAFREPVRDVRRIVLNENFKNLVYNYLGQNAYKNLKKWTSDCWAEEPIPRTAYEKGMAKLRNAQTMGTMGFRVTMALLNIANAPSVAHYMGAAELLHSLKKFYSAPRLYTDFVFQRSVFMAERAETMDASIHDALKGPNILEGIPGIGKAGEVIKNNAFKMITWTDLMLALPLWQHEYEKTYNAEVDAGRSPQQAREAGVNAGDAAVRWCFGSGRTVDKAAIQRKGSELMKQLTMYYSYNSTVYNALNYKLWEAKVGYKKAVAASAKNKSIALMKAVAHAGDALLMWVLLPAVISALLRAGASGDDDDWKIEKLIKSMGQESLTGIVGGIPVLRDAVPYFMAKVFDEHQFAPKIPIQNTIEQTNRVIQSAVSDKKTISDTLREMGKLTSQVTGAPSTLIDSFTTTLQYLESGFDESVADYLRALIFDKRLKKNQK